MPYSHPTRRDLYWREFQKFFDTLPLEQFLQANLFSHNLALWYSDDAQLRAILLRRQDYPLLDQHFWLFDDWSFHNPIFEKHLLLGLAFRFMELELKAAVAHPFSHQDETFLPLAETLAGQADFYFKDIELFGQTHDKPAPDQWALIALSTTAAALAADKESQLPQLLELTDHLRLAYQTVAELSSLRVDLRDGRMSYPIQQVMKAAGIRELKNLSADFLFGVMALTGTLEKICVENHERVEAARALTHELRLPTFAEFCDHTDALLRQIRNQFGLKNQAGGNDEPLRAFFAPAVDVIPNVIQKAEGYLLSDLTFHEAWEVQQNTFKAYPLLIAQAFPSSLILEALAQHGHTIAPMVDTVFKIYQTNDFRYYDVVETTVPDIDTIAFALRLHRYSSQPGWCKEILQRPLRWVRENQLPSGQIPVWLRRNDSKYQFDPLAVLYGENCATVEANLLIGLIDFDWDGYQDVISACAASWCERWLAMGLGATGHYPPLFSFWTSLELIARLLKHPIHPTLRDDLIQLAARLVERMQIEGAHPDLTPQNASFLLLACLRLPEFSLPFDPPRWLTTLIKHQQWDGKWQGEPIYVTPSGRGLGTAWYTSHTITTAFCYHALKTYQASLAPAVDLQKVAEPT